MSTEGPKPDQLDHAVQARLRRLHRLRFDSAEVEQRLESVLAELQEASSIERRWPLRFRQPLLAAAALVVVAATLTIVLMRASQDVVFIPVTEVVLAHEEFLDGSHHVIEVQSVDQANRECQARWPGAPTIPEVEGVSVQCCCVEEFCGCRTGCLHFDHEGVPVTMAVITEKEFDAPGVSLVEQGNRSYKVLSRGRFSIVAAAGTDRCICLVSELPQEKLLALADRIDL